MELWQLDFIFWIAKIAHFPIFLNYQGLPAKRVRELQSQKKWWHKLFYGEYHKSKIKCSKTNLRKKFNCTYNLPVRHGDQVTRSHFQVFPKNYEFCKVQSLWNLWTNFHRILLRTDVIAEKIGHYTAICSLLICIYRSDYWQNDIDKTLLCFNRQ